MTTPDPGLPFAATVAGVRAFVVSLAAEGQRPASVLAGGASRRTSDATVADWLTEAGALVDLRIPHYTILPATDADASVAGMLTQEKVAAAGRHLVQLYAAALLMDTNLPERSAQNHRESGRGPGAPLMDRFYKLLEDLGKSVDLATAPGSIDTVSAGGSVQAPPPRFPRDMGF